MCRVAKLLVSLMCLMLVLTTVTVYAQTSWIKFTSTPPYGEFGYAAGEVGNVNPANYRVAVYIYVEGWWTKPYFAWPLTTIEPNGRWFCYVTTGGYDRYATKFAAFLLPVGVNPPLASGQIQLPIIPEAVAFTQIERGPQTRIISFAGYNYIVKRRDFPAGPGPNYFSDNPEDIWVDDQGMHLTIHERDGRWYCTEAILNESFGYGTYVFQTRGRVDIIDPMMVIGLFTWDDTDPSWNYREMDIEFAKWGDLNNPTNAQYVVQPPSSDRLVRFRVDLTDENSDLTHYMIWEQGKVTFKTYRGRYLGLVPNQNSLVNEWSYMGTVPPPGNENIRFNFWLFNGSSPLSGGGNEFIVTGFAYSPLSGGPSNIRFISRDFSPAAPTQLVPGSPLFLGAFLENNGGENTGPFWLEFWGSKTGGITLDYFLADSELIPNIAPGRSYPFERTRALYSIPDGPYTVVFVIDRPNQVQEANEADNRWPVAGKRLFTIRPQTSANITVRNFSFGPNPVLNGGILQLGGEVINTGTENTGPFWIEFWGSSERLYPNLHFFLCDSIFVSNLAPAEVVNLFVYSRILYYCPSGIFAVGVVVDRNDLVNELDETDNHKFVDGIIFNP